MLEVTPDGTIREVESISGIVFRSRDTGQETSVAVKDKFPKMGDVHIEGRRIVEVSIEMFVSLMDQVGWDSVDPNELGPNEEFADEVEKEDG